MSLEAAQIAKMRLVAEKLDLKPGGSVEIFRVDQWIGDVSALVKGLFSHFWVDRVDVLCFLPYVFWSLRCLES